MSNLSRRSFLRTGLAGGATLAVSTVSTAALAAKPAKGLYIPGTYSAKAAGIGDIVVTMTFDENRITDVVLNVAHETPSIGQAAAERLKSSLMAAQSAQIDVVSGASITSNAVMKAAGKCIAQAKGEIPVEVVSNGADADADSGDWLGKAPEIAEKSITATYTTDVLVVGCGTGGLFAVCAAAEEGAKVIGIDRFSTGTGVRGDGIRACLWAGAAMDETHSTMLFDRCALRIDQPTGAETAKKGDSGFFWIGSQPWLKVNADGKRFFNESGTYENILHADEYQKGHCHYTLFDANWPEQTKQFKMHGCSRVHPFENGADPNILWSVFAEKMLPGLIEKGFVVKADTIEELARKLGLPEKTLKATVERYNTLAQNGRDEDYGKEPHRLAPLTKAPFYGAKNTGYILCTMDGIRIDTTMNAIDTDGNPIPGLYVIGNDSGGFFANTYPNLATGVACGRTVTFGRLVGKHLAKA